VPVKNTDTVLPKAVQPVYFDGFDCYESIELNRRAMCYSLFIELVYKHNLGGIRKLNKMLGIKNSRQLLEGNIAEHKWEEIIKFTAKIISDNLLRKADGNG
jgi:hypothetical protein